MGQSRDANAAIHSLGHNRTICSNQIYKCSSTNATNTFTGAQPYNMPQPNLHVFFHQYNQYNQCIQCKPHIHRGSHNPVEYAGQPKSTHVFQHRQLNQLNQHLQQHILVGSWASLRRRISTCSAVFGGSHTTKTPIKCENDEVTIQFSTCTLRNFETRSQIEWLVLQMSGN